MWRVAKKKLFLLFVISLAAFTLDRLTKYYFVAHPNQAFTIFPKILILELQKNPGMVFGFVVNDLLYYVSFSIIALILFYLLADSYKKNNFYLLSCLIFIIIGAFSNLLDRLKYGAVVDFINVPFWSVFNLADCYIVAAVVLWIVILFKHEKFSKNN